MRVARCQVCLSSGERAASSETTTSSTDPGYLSSIQWLMRGLIWFDLAWLRLDLGLILVGFFVGFGLDLGWISASTLDSRMHTNFTFCSFLHFHHIFTSCAILIRSEAIFGHVPGRGESHVH